MTVASTLTQRHRAQQLLLRKATVSQLAHLWPALDWNGLDQTYPQFAVKVAAMVQRNRQTSSGLAASYIKAFRKANGIPGELKVVFAQPLIVDQFQATLHSTSVAALKNSASNGVTSDVAMRNALTLTQGSMSRLVLNGGRETSLATMAVDDQVVGYRRILGTGGCSFCQDLADRVYPTDNADFQAHGSCACSSELVYA